MKKGTAVIYKNKNSNLFGEFGTIVDIKEDGTYMVHFYFDEGDVDINAKEDELKETVRIEAVGGIRDTISGEKKLTLICPASIHFL